MTVLFGRYAIDFNQVHAFSTQAQGWISEFAKSLLDTGAIFFGDLKLNDHGSFVLDQLPLQDYFFPLKNLKLILSFNLTLLDIEIKDNKVVGAFVNFNGEIKKIKINQGIVLAMGGFGKSQMLRDKYLPQPTNKDWGCEPNTNTGDWIEIAKKLMQS